MAKDDNEIEDESSKMSERKASRGECEDRGGKEEEEERERNK